MEVTESQGCNLVFPDRMTQLIVSQPMLYPKIIKNMVKIKIPMNEYGWEHN